MPTELMNWKDVVIMLVVFMPLICCLGDWLNKHGWRI